MISLENLTTMLTRVQNLTTMLVTTVLHRTVFECRDGKIQRCSRWVMELSDFFSVKVKGFDRFGNELKFDYTQYNQETIKLFLDLLHGISAQDVSLEKLVELYAFLAYEGKNGTELYLKLPFNLF